MNIRSAKIGINTLITIPVFIILCFSAIQINTHLLKTNHFKKLQQLNLLIQDIGSLVYELQLERGLSVVYLAGGGQQFISKIHQQRELSDIKRQTVLAALQAYDKKELPGSRRYQTLFSFMQTLNNIEDIRQKIDMQTISSDDTLAFYSLLNNHLLDFVASQIREFPDADLHRNFIAYTQFLYGMENAGIERALLGEIFTRKEINLKHYQKFLLALNAQTSHHDEFIKLADSELVTRFEQMLTDKHNTQVEEYRNLLHKSVTRGEHEINNVNTMQWFTTVSQKIKHHKTLEVLINTYQQNKISEVIAESRSILYFWLFICLFTLLNWIVIGIVLARKIKRSITAELSQYQKLFNQSESATVVTDPDNQCYFFCNAAFARLLNYPETEIAGMPCSRAHPDELGSHIQGLFTNLKPENPQSIENLQFKRSDGSLFWADVISFPIMISGKYYIGANIKDNTERRASERTLQTVLDSINQAVAVTHLHSYDLIYLNEQARQFQQIEGSCDTISSVVLNSLRDTPANSQQGQYETTSEKDIFNKHNQRWYQFRARRIPWYDGSSVALHMLEDITEQHEFTEKIERLLRENRALTKRNFDIQEQIHRDIAMELHDQLGQLIAVIIMKSDQLMAQLKDPGDEVAHNLNQISDTARHIANSVNQVINRLRPVLLDQLGLQDAIGELVQNWQQLNPAISYQFLSSETLPPLSDKVAITLYRIAQESLTNASKHAWAKNIEVSLSYCPDEDVNASAGLLTLTVADDGIGLGGQYKKSSGMGLINMRERMWSVGGSVEIESQTGAGLVIRATLQLT